MLKVKLAGHNVDVDVLEKIKGPGKKDSINATPETISAAYARISRDPRPVTKLREAARKEVGKARKSNENIVFKMGHHSVAEHAYLNFDITGLSRLAAEYLEEARLCSYTEKSQRYITLKGDYVLPAELNAAEKKLFTEAIKAQASAYKRAFPVLHEYQKEKNSGMLGKKRGEDTVEGWAKEDARYMVSMATECQLGFSANARNLEYIIRKLKYSPLGEARRLSGLLYKRAKAVVPSLIILSDPGAFKRQFGWEVSDGFLDGGREKLEKISAPLVKKHGKSTAGARVKLVDYTKGADAAVTAALMYSSGRASYSGCLKAAKKSAGARGAFMKKFFKNFTAFDAMPREFEAADFIFEIEISAGAFAQLKRHRMMSLFKQPYDILLGTRIPPSIEKTGLKNLFMGVMRASEAAYGKIKRKKGRAIAEYALTNAHKRRVIVKSNLREIYHIARLRMDSHAQWDIRDISADMIKEVKKKAPLTAALACGKDKFNEVYKGFMG